MDMNRLNDMLDRYGEVCTQKTAGMSKSQITMIIGILRSIFSSAYAEGLIDRDPTLTPHYFRHNYVTMLYEAGVDPLIAMKIVGHTDYQTTANIYTHVRDELLKKATVKMGDVFRKHMED